MGKDGSMTATVLPVEGTTPPADGDAALRAAYRTCRRMQRRHDPTYYWATRRLPSHVRPAVHALYGFVRGADEIVDGDVRAADATARRAALDAWEGELERGLAAGRSGHPVIAALVDAGRRHALPLEELHTYMDSMRLDCGPVRIRDRAELDRYMRGSAGAVGVIMAPLLGAPEQAGALARMAAGFQLTNFIRDVVEDFTLDRIYLPGAREEDLRERAAGERLRAVVADEVARARELFASTAAVADGLAPPLRPGVRLARAVYGRVLDRVEAIGFDVVGRRAALPPWQAAGAAARSLLAGARP
jgi:phytoene synthase